MEQKHVLADEQKPLVQTAPEQNDAAGEEKKVKSSAPREEIPADRKRGKAYFCASRIAKIAMFAALAYVVTFLEFPIFPAAPFYSLIFQAYSCFWAVLCTAPSPR